ncbi:MAG: hypothetical protein DRI69_10590 [Bacteroidetes bacterium]|nr:MAG: hypothetical protein DRI69_10590 [Bacteroidota bacterium]
MLLSTTYDLPGYKITEHLDVVRGNTVRARHLGRDIMAGIKNIIGGEITSYTELMVDAREQAMARMIADAEHLGADAVIGMRFVTATVMQGASELVAYGTAVRIQKIDLV